MRRRAKSSQESTIDVTISELSQGGQGVAIHSYERPAGRRSSPPVDPERRAVFVPNVAVGERVRVAVDFTTRPARGRLLEILEASPDRVASRCPDVGPCGGCDWMHIEARAREQMHATLVKKVLPRAYMDMPVRTHAAPQEWAYRTRTRLHVEAKKQHVSVGMFGRRSHAPVPVETCFVLDPVLDRARRLLPELLQGAHGHAEALLSLGAPKDRRGAVLDLRFEGQKGEPLPASTFAKLERAVASGELDGARVFDGEVKVPAVVGDPTPWIRGADDAPLKLAPGGFSQATESGNRLLSQRVAELARSVVKDGAPIVELYAGAGNLTVLLARTLRVTAVEASAEACAAARANLSSRSLEATLVCADAATHAIDRGTKLVVLDPPRTGAREVTARLEEHVVPAILYVSCDPPTLGRDIATLTEAGYELRAVETFEMFPQTSHVETLALLVHREKGQKR